MFKRLFRGRSSKTTTTDKSTIRDTGLGSAPRAQEIKKEELTPYERIRDQCIQDGVLWEDPEFPAEQSSLFTKEPPSCWPGVEWKRPHEICSDPQMFVDGATRMDVIQGALGDCWLLAAVASLSTNPTLLQNVFPVDQFFDKQYAGIFRCRFWQFGRWIEVLIDDRLPTKNNKLIYMHSADRNEFWSALLEKAYAKLYGNYEALTGGLTVDAMTDFCGGVTSRYELRDKTPPMLLATMLKAKRNGSIMGCSIDSSAENREQQLSNGLIIGHAYSITDVRMVNVTLPTTSGKLPMVRIRNPWGGSHEWKGAWGDGSKEWNYVSAEERAELGLVYNHDGEFWMSYKDFTSNFQRIEICFLGPDSIISDPAHTIHWESSIVDGYWQHGVNAGGCRNYPRTFWCNPQYRVTVEDADTDDEDGNGTLLVGVMQKNRKNKGKDNLGIGYYIFSLDSSSTGTLSRRHFENYPPTQKGAFSDMREVSDVHKVPPGDYVVVPCTFEPNVDAEYLLRIFSERAGDKMAVIDDPTDKGQVSTELVEKETDADKTRLEEASEEFISRAGTDGQMSAFELQQLLNDRFPLNEYQIDGFSLDMTRTMVAISDTDMQGTLGYSEYKVLIEDLTFFMKAFSVCDSDGNGYISSFELRYALNLLGYRVSNATFVAIATRYKNHDDHVTFDDFLMCCLKLKAVLHAFKVHDKSEVGQAKFPLTNFLEQTMHC